jgi:hypothetical protein
MEEKLLQAQEEKGQKTKDQMRQPSESASSIEDTDAKRPSSKDFKSPPSYAVDDDSKSPARINVGEDDRGGCSNLKSPPLHSEDANKKEQQQEDLIVLSASQLLNEDSSDKRKITFRGAYRPSGLDVDRICVISSVQVQEPTTNTSSSSAAAGSASYAAASASASSRKRGRNACEDDDGSVDGDRGVEYQELIDLHDEAGLSTEELRRRYYGGAATVTAATTGQGVHDDDTKNPSSSTKRARQDTDDEDDDGYGF